MRRAFVSHEHRLILYWSPKCGCTSLADWMVFGLLQREGVPRSRTRHWLGENGYFAKARDLLGETKGYHSVAFTRDPFDRIVSAFGEQIHREVSNGRLCEMVGVCGIA